MSILGSISNSANMNAPGFHEFKKQASFFLKEKIKTARLVLTDVTPAQLLVEEATDGNPGGPDAHSLKIISRASFEVDDYWRIVEILHKKLAKFDRRYWRESYNAMIVLEYLITHGPESVAEEFQSDRDVIRELENFRYVDEKGFDWGLNVAKKSERIVNLLEKGPLLKEERSRARKISRGIEGFGSFCHRTESGEGIQQESSAKTMDRCNPQFSDQGSNRDFLTANKENWGHKSSQIMKNLDDVRINMKKNMVPQERNLVKKFDEWSWSSLTEAKPLLDDQSVKSRINLAMEDHPFNDVEHQTTMSLL